MLSPSSKTACSLLVEGLFTFEVKVFTSAFLEFAEKTASFIKK